MYVERMWGKVSLLHIFLETFSNLFDFCCC